MNYNRNRTKTTKWNIFFHYSNFIFVFISGILLVPLYLKYIPANIYGYWLATGNILNWVSLIDPGFSMVTQQKVAFSYGNKRHDQVGKYAVSSLQLTLIFLIPITALGMVFYFKFPEWIGINDLIIQNQLQTAFIYALIGTLFSFVSYTIVSINQGLQSSLGIGTIYVFSNVVGIVLTVCGLVYGYGIISLGIANIGRGGVLLLGNSIYLIVRFAEEKIKLYSDKAIAKEILSLISFNFLGKIGSIGNSQIASFLIAKYLSPNDVIAYRFTLTIPETSKLLLGRPALALMPAVNHLLGEGDIQKSKQIFLRLLKYLVWSSGLVLAGFIIFNKPFIGLWTDAKYYGGFGLNLVLVIWVIVSTFTTSLSNMVFALGDIKKNNIVRFIQSIFYIILFMVSIHFWGLLGAGISLLIAEIFVPMIYYPISFRKRIRLERELIMILVSEAIHVLLISIALIVTLYLINPAIDNWFVFGCWTVGLCLVYFIILSISSLNFKNEINNFINILKNKKKS